MVLLVDLEDAVHDPHVDPAAATGFATLKQQLRHASTTSSNHVTRYSSDERPNPNVNGFSAALSCYPVVSQLASLLDLNDLHNLSRACRQFRANLLESRTQLKQQSLRCVNEDAAPGAKLADRLREARNAWTNHGSSSPAARLTSGKVGRCARDLVNECNHCGTVVCRNCAMKPLPASALKDRHRRLCRTCSKAPIAVLTSPRRRRSTSPTATRISPPPPPSFEPSSPAISTFTNPDFRRPCTCEVMVWLCQPCGQSVRSDDTMYLRAWTWRTKYTHYLGGLGTGIGEGNEGVECGRKSNCLAAKTVEHEIDCDAESLALLQEEAAKIEAEGTGRSWKGTSYMMQEIEGIGGVVKRKVKKRVKVGAVVREHEDEREKGVQRLEREANGQVRSWCAWCERVVLSPEDLKDDGSQETYEARPVSSSASSEFSVVVGRKV